MAHSFNYAENFTHPIDSEFIKTIGGVTTFTGPISFDTTTGITETALGDDFLIYNVDGSLQYRKINTLGGAIFDQSLNTTDGVQFQTLRVNQALEMSQGVNPAFAEEVLDYGAVMPLANNRQKRLIGNSQTRLLYSIDNQNNAANADSVLQLRTDLTGSLNQGGDTYIEFTNSGANSWAVGRRHKDASDAFIWNYDTTQLNIDNTAADQMTLSTTGELFAKALTSNDLTINSNSLLTSPTPEVFEVALISPNPGISQSMNFDINTDSGGCIELRNAGTGNTCYRIRNVGLGNAAFSEYVVGTNIFAAGIDNALNEYQIWNNDFGGGAKIAAFTDAGDQYIFGESDINTLKIRTPPEDTPLITRREEFLSYDTITKEVFYQRVIRPNYFNIGCFNNSTETVIAAAGTQYPITWLDLTNVDYAGNQAGFTQLVNTGSIIKNNYLVGAETAIVRITYHITIQTVAATQTTFEMNIKTSDDDTNFTVNVPLSYSVVTTNLSGVEYELSNSCLITFSNVKSIQLFINNRTNTNNIIVEDASITAEFLDFL